MGNERDMNETALYVIWFAVSVVALLALLFGFGSPQIESILQGLFTGVIAGFLVRLPEFLVSG